MTTESMDADDRTPDEQAILDEYKSKISRSYEVWDRFVLKGTFLNWEDAVLAGSEQWLDSPHIYDCRVRRITYEMASIEAQDVHTYRWMTTSTVIAVRVHTGLVMFNSDYAQEFDKHVKDSSTGKWLPLPSTDFAEVVDYRPFKPMKTAWHSHAA